MVKVITPPRVGWEVHAREAFEKGGIDAMADVVKKHPADADIFGMCMSSSAALVTLPRMPGRIAAGGTAELLVKAVRKHWASASSSVSSADDAAELEDGMATALSMLQAVAKQDVERFVALDTVPMLAEIASRACSCGEAAGERPLPRAAAAALGLLDLIGRSRRGQDTLTADGTDYIRTVAHAAGSWLETDAAEAAAAAAGPASGAGRGGSGAADPFIAGGAASQQQQTGELLAPGARHMAPAFRLLDRVSRTEAGLALLDAVPDVVGLLSGSLDAVSADETLEAVVVRLLSRLLRGDLRGLVLDVGRASNGSEEGLESCARSARLLASLCRDAETVDSVMSAGPVDPSDDDEDKVAAKGASSLPESMDSMLAQLMQLVSTCAEARARLALVEVVRRVAASSQAGQDRCLEEGAPTHILGEMSVDFESAKHAGEAARALEALVGDQAGAVGLLGADPPYEIEEVSPSEGQTVMEAMLLLSLKTHASSSDAAGAVLSLLEHLLVHGGAVSQAGLEQAAATAAEAMGHNPSVLALHCKALALLNAAIGTAGVLDAALGAGLLPVLIADLSGACEKGRSGGRAAAKGKGSSSKSTGGSSGGIVSAEQLVVLAMFLLATVCEKQEALAEAKHSGCIRAVLLAFARFPRSSAVYERFREVIEALQISDSEVIAAVL